MKPLSRSGLRALCVGWAAAVLLSACGGGGGNAGNCVSGSAQVCAADTPADPGQAPATSSEALANMCTLEGEKRFTRAYLDETYLWYDEIPAVNAAAYSQLDAYFYALLTPRLDTSGQLKDRFSFIVPSTDADALLTGSNIGYGVDWETDTQGRPRVAFVEAGSPAQASGLARGGELVRVLSTDANWFPNAQASISFIYRSAPGAATQTITLGSAPVQEDPVPRQATLASPAGRRVAYLLFNAHTSGAQDKLIPAVQAAQAAGAQDLVLDMRYNGGGYLYVAETLSAMLSGPPADGQVFEQLRYNSKRQSETNSSTYLFSGVVENPETVFAAGTPLPRLALPRVFILTSGSTCSASESVINSLRGIGVQVVLIGQTTCGKPYGFSRRDNCGLAYFPIEFQGVNAQGFGDYATGFTPTCTVPDDFEHALGAPNERMLSAALTYIDTGACPAQPAPPAFSSVPGVEAQRPHVRGKVLLPAR